MPHKGDQPAIKLPVTRYHREEMILFTKVRPTQFEKKNPFAFLKRWWSIGFIIFGKSRRNEPPSSAAHNATHTADLETWLIARTGRLLRSTTRCIIITVRKSQHERYTIRRSSDAVMISDHVSYSHAEAPISFKGTLPSACSLTLNTFIFAGCAWDFEKANRLTSGL